MQDNVIDELLRRVAQYAGVEPPEKPQTKAAVPSENMRSMAAELADVPHDYLLTVYRMLLPHTATERGLAEAADTLEKKYNAPLAAKFVRSAAEEYIRLGYIQKN